MDKDQKVTLFRTAVKSIFVFMAFTTFYWLSWNLLFVDTLGIGIKSSEWWVFGLPTLFTFYILKLINPIWLFLLKVSNFIIYSILLFGWLILMIYF